MGCTKKKCRTMACKNIGKAMILPRRRIHRVRLVFQRAMVIKNLSLLIRLTFQVERQDRLAKLSRKRKTHGNSVAKKEEVVLQKYIYIMSLGSRLLTNMSLSTLQATDMHTFPSSRYMNIRVKENGGMCQSSRMPKCSRREKKKGKLDSL